MTIKRDWYIGLEPKEIEDTMVRLSADAMYYFIKAEDEKANENDRLFRFYYTELVEAIREQRNPYFLVNDEIYNRWDKLLWRVIGIGGEHRENMHNIYFASCTGEFVKKTPLTSDSQLPF